MKSKWRFLYWSVEINLVLWFMSFGLIVADVDTDEYKLSGKIIVIIGLIFSAIVQHWAYYNIRKEYKEK